MIVVGLTGSIAMGKSTVAAMFAALACPVFDADDAVRQFYRAEGAALVEAAFPGVMVSGALDRDKLSAYVLGDGGAMKRLEAIVHPAVGSRRGGFLRDARAAGKRVAFLDVPLLFETGGDRALDLVVVGSARPETQRARALAREGMTEAKFDALLARQTPDSEKRRRAHFVIDTDRSIEDTRAQAEGFVRAVAAMAGRGIGLA
jgi:dephospho-CoA kinase